MIDLFHKFSAAITRAVGSPWALVLAFLVILAWAVTGPIFHFSDTWQLVINTGTTVVTFLMVFVIQASQNREARVTQLKLDELIHAARGARDSMIALEEAPEDRVQLHIDEMKTLAEMSTDAQLDEVEAVARAAKESRRTRRRTSNGHGRSNGSDQTKRSNGTTNASARRSSRRRTSRTS
jgi:low affinity Fe/Cu permease